MRALPNPLGRANKIGHTKNLNSRKEVLMNASNPLLAVLMGAALSFPLFASANEAHHAQGSSAQKVAQTTWSEAEVRKVDRDGAKVTLKHGPILNLGMTTGMTMAFRVSDPAMLEQVKPGDKIRFTADRVNGAYTVTALEKS
jgi:Cu(I)/Ag(I) efflux system periplasmic protein CusF